MPVFTTFSHIQELTVSGDTSRRNYRGIFISIVVLTLISSLIIASIFLVNPDILKFSKLFQIKEKILLEEAIFDQLGPKQWNVQWLDPIPSSQIISQDRADQSSENDTDTLFFLDHDKEVRLLHLGKQFDLEQRYMSISSLTPSLQQSPNSIEQTLIEGPKLNFSTLVSKSSLLMSQEYYDYKLSPSRRYILAISDKTKIYRHTFIANFHIYDIEQDKFIPLSFPASDYNNNQNDNSPQSIDNDDINYKNVKKLHNAAPDSTNGRFQCVKWIKVPNRANEDALFIVYNNDIYYKSSVHSKEIRLTHSGRAGVIYNGIPDWLYEEEILSQDNAIAISPSSSKMAYMKFDDSRVDSMRIPYYGSVEEPLPQLLSVRYPKAGRVNPTVEVYVVDLREASPESIQLQLPEDLKVEQHYIGSMGWLTDDKLSLTWLNRDQNISYILNCQQSNSDKNSWPCKKNLLLEAEYGWLEPLKVLPFDDEHYFALMPKYESDRLGYFKHIAKVSIETGKYSFLTGGEREVTEILSIDSSKKRVYYLSTQTYKPDVRHLYWTNIDAGSNKSSTDDNEDNCITCNLDEGCQYNDIKFSPSNRFYVFACLGPGIPKYQLRSIDEILFKQANLEKISSSPIVTNSGPNEQTTTVQNSVNVTDQTRALNIGNHPEIAIKTDKNLVWSIEENVELQEKLKLKAMPQVKRLFVPVGRNGQYNASVIMLLPPKIKDDEDRNIQYPMVVNVYGGPGSQHVDQRFDLNYGHYIASNKNIIYTMIDPRGCGYQGSNMLFEVYLRFGSIEIEDQIVVTRYLIEMFPFIDKHKVAIWGWSYGGYSAAMSLAQGSMPMSSTDQPMLDNINRLTTHLPTSPHEHPREVFECAVSVAPVTNWLYYDTAYTERYMSSPYKNEQYDRFRAGDHNEFSSHTFIRDDPPDLARQTIKAIMNKTYSTAAFSDLANINSSMKDLNSTIPSKNMSSPFLSEDLNDRYRKASLLDFVSHMDRKRFLLVHGTADDNVHFQQSVMLMKLLIKLNILYETQLYPDEDHSINHYAAKLHLYSTMNDFFGECFDIALSYDNISFDMQNHRHQQKHRTKK